MSNIHIVNLKDDNHKGDDNNAKAVTNATMKMLVDKSVMNTTLHIDEVMDFISFHKDDKNTKFIFIGAGEQSLSPLSSAKTGLEACTIWSSHQAYASIADHEHNLDKIALPLTETFELKDPNKRVETLGVPNEINAKDIIAQYEEKKANVIPSNNGYIMTVMGGDANNPELEKTETNPNQIEFYEVEEAIKLAEYLVTLHKKTNGKKLLITNGPRTGKHDIFTGQETQNHRGDTETDPCSQALLDTLKENGLEEGKDFQFADFRFKPEGGVDSAYTTFLGAALSQRDDSLILMAGESTSMLTDCLNLGAELAAFENNAMNDSHYNFFKMLSNNDFIVGTDKNFKAVKKTDEFKIEPAEYIRAEEQIAKKIIEIATPPYREYAPTPSM